MAEACPEERDGGVFTWQTVPPIRLDPWRQALLAAVTAFEEVVVAEDITRSARTEEAHRAVDMLCVLTSVRAAPDSVWGIHAERSSRFCNPS